MQLRTFPLIAASALLLLACNPNANPIINASSEVTVENGGLIVEPQSASLQAGATLQLQALMSQNGEINRNLPTNWVSLSPDIATVSNDGKVTALKPGSVQITAETLGKQANTVLTITPAPEAASTPGTTPPASNPSIADDGSQAEGDLARLRTIVIRPANEVVQPTIFKLSRLGETRPFEAIGKDSQGSEIPNLTFSWSSSDENIATVNSTGVVTAVATGTTNLIATAGDISSNTVVVQVQEGSIQAHIRFSE